MEGTQQVDDELQPFGSVQLFCDHCGVSVDEVSVPTVAIDRIKVLVELDVSSCAQLTWTLPVSITFWLCYHSPLNERNDNLASPLEMADCIVCTERAALRGVDLDNVVVFLAQRNDCDLQ